MANLKNINVGGVNYGLGLTIEEIKTGIDFENLQKKLTAGAGIAIEADGTIKTTLDTDVFKVVESLPEQPEAGNENKIHVAPNPAGTGQNIYNEYIWADGKWEEVGSFKADVDLTGYVKKTDQISASLITEVADKKFMKDAERTKLEGISAEANKVTFTVEGDTLNIVVA